MPDPSSLQIQFQLACTQRLWCDFVAYHPDANQPLYVQRIMPEIKLIKEIHDKALVFIAEVEEKYKAMKKRNSEELYKYL